VFQNQAIVLTVIRKLLDFGLNVEGGRLTERRTSYKPVLLDINLRAPGRRHVQGLGSYLEPLIFIHPLEQLSSR